MFKIGYDVPFENSGTWVCYDTHFGHAVFVIVIMPFSEMTECEIVMTSSGMLICEIVIMSLSDKPHVGWLRHPFRTYR